MFEIAANLTAGRSDFDLLLLRVLQRIRHLQRPTPPDASLNAYRSSEMFLLFVDQLFPDSDCPGGWQQVLTAIQDGKAQRQTTFQWRWTKADNGAWVPSGKYFQDLGDEFMLPILAFLCKTDRISADLYERLVNEAKATVPGIKQLGKVGGYDASPESASVLGRDLTENSRQPGQRDQVRLNELQAWTAGKYTLVEKIDFGIDPSSSGSWSPGDRSVFYDPNTLAFYIEADPARAVREFLSTAVETPPKIEALCYLAGHWNHRLFIWNPLRAFYGDGTERFWHEYHRIMTPLFAETGKVFLALLQVEGGRVISQSDLVAVLFEFLHALGEYISDPVEMDELQALEDQLVPPALDLARRCAGAFRKDFGSTSDAQDAKYMMGSQWRAVELGIRLIAWNDSPFAALKYLFTILRGSRQPMVNFGLRYWLERREFPFRGDSGVDIPPEPFIQIPQQLAQVLHAAFGRMQVSDPELLDLRTDLSRFFLDRLKSKTESNQNGKKAPKQPVGDLPMTNNGMVEPSPIWRYFYIRAIRALRINPEGRGHHTLHWSAHHDPDPEIRNAAKSAETELRHGPKLGAVSPRRAIFTAFWFVRQAHVRWLAEIPGMGHMTINSREAQRTLGKEVQRTTQPKW